jgi:hypothetical protein
MSRWKEEANDNEILQTIDLMGNSAHGLYMLNIQLGKRENEATLDFTALNLRLCEPGVIAPGFFIASNYRILIQVAPITYLSTRKSAAGTGGVGIEEAIAQGMPSDGGLFVPDKLPALPARVFHPGKLGYAELAYLVLEPFFPDWGPKLRSILETAYGSLFDHPEIAP